jgi:hypothetical protein
MNEDYRGLLPDDFDYGDTPKHEIGKHLDRLRWDNKYRNEVENREKENLAREVRLIEENKYLQIKENNLFNQHLLDLIEYIYSNGYSFVNLEKITFREWVLICNNIPSYPFNNVFDIFIAGPMIRIREISNLTKDSYHLVPSRSPKQIDYMDRLTDTSNLNLVLEKNGTRIFLVGPIRTYLKDLKTKTGYIEIS